MINTLFQTYNNSSSETKLSILTSTITLFGIVLVFIVGLINIGISKKQLKLENLTKHRVEWLYDMKKNFSEYFEHISIENLRSLSGDYEDFRGKLEKLDSLIRLNLNFTGDIDNRILKFITIINVNIHFVLNLKLLKAELNRSNFDSQQAFKLFFKKYGTEGFLLYLHERYLSLNKKIGDDHYKNMNRFELEKLVMNDYVSFVDGREFSFVYLHQIDDDIYELIGEIAQAKYSAQKNIWIYLKSEWRRVNFELKKPAYRKYNEKKNIIELEEIWKKNNSNIT